MSKNYRVVFRLLVRLELLGFAALLLVAGLISISILILSFALSTFSHDTSIGLMTATAASARWFWNVTIWGAWPTFTLIVPYFVWLVSKAAVKPVATMVGAIIIVMVSALAFGSIAPLFVIVTMIALISLIVSRPKVFGLPILQ